MAKKPRLLEWLVPNMTEVAAPHGRYVIRARPIGSPDGWLAYNPLFGALVRVIGRDKRWVVQVRRWSDDPYGPVALSEIIPSVDEAKSTVADVEHRLHRGELDQAPT
jgi:hypothetical protein